MLITKEDARVSPEVASIRNLTDTYIRYKQYRDRLDRQYDYYHPSEWAKCLRMHQYKHYVWTKGIPFEYPELDSKLIRIFDTGHFMHARFQQYFDDMGHILMGRWQCTNPLCHLVDKNGEIHCTAKDLANTYEKGFGRIYDGENHQPIFKPERCVCGNKKFRYVETLAFDERLKIRGNADLVINCDNLDLNIFKKEVRNTCDDRFLPKNGRKIVIDMKSMGSRQFEEQVKRKKVRRDHMVQLNIYINMLDCDYGVLFYENKDNCDVDLVRVERDPQMWEVIQHQAEQMVAMRRIKALPPPLPADKKNADCLSCSFKELCHASPEWKDPNLQGRREEFYKCLL
jgi:CRISPR/Cas system-associated exonuclease Cas4 (RecB family)